MPYTISDDLTRMIADWLNQGGTYSQGNIVRMVWNNEITAYEQANLQKGLNPNGTPNAQAPRPIEQVLPPGVQVTGPPLTRQQRRLAERAARKMNGHAPAALPPPADVPPSAEPVADGGGPS